MSINGRALSSYIGVLEKFITPQLDDEAKKKKAADGQFPYIAFDSDLFCDQMMFVRKLFDKRNKKLDWRHKHRFVDVGCGIGSKLLIASDILGGFEICGIEYSKEYVKVANQLISHTYEFRRPYVIEFNALELDYTSFDVIYFYCPLINVEKQMALEERIFRTAKPGAIIVANLAKNGMIWQTNKVKKLDSGIYEKLTQVEAHPDATPVEAVVVAEPSSSEEDDED